MGSGSPWIVAEVRPEAGVFFFPAVQSLRPAGMGACDGITWSRVQRHICFRCFFIPGETEAQECPCTQEPFGAGFQLGRDQRREDRRQVSSSLVSLTAQHTALPCLLPPHCLVPVSSKPFSFSFLTRVPSSPSRSSAEGLAKDDLRLLILLPPKFWDYTCAPPCLPGVVFYSFFLRGCVFGEELN